MAKIKITLGADPEFFLIDRNKERITSAHDIVPGTKDSPYPLPSGGGLQADGLAVEFNTAPAQSGEEFAENTKKSLEDLRKFIPENYEFFFSPTVYFDPFYFEKLDPKNKELGCSVDFNAWKSGGMNPRPIPPKDKPFMRTASGHLHIGWTTNADTDSLSHRWDCCQVIKALDTIIGPFLKLWDKDEDRAQLYGKPGAHRPKSYGVEWRVPSNAWLNHPDIWPWLFDSVSSVVTALKDKGLDTLEVDGSYAQTVLGLNAWARLYIRDFPILTTEFSKYEDSAVKKGVRVAATGNTVRYDLDLDVPRNENRQYAAWNPSIDHNDVLF